MSNLSMFTQPRVCLIANIENDTLKFKKHYVISLLLSLKANKEPNFQAEAGLKGLQTDECQLTKAVFPLAVLI